ncbi:MAG: hypothetical protein LBG45_11400 [Dysgonamonadaceae bacterium]|jgi:hypothetical protein|nr:hypothetical protein [Dysgonamonadaceae bacterium]
MKKNIYFLILSLLVWSCSQDAVINNESPLKQDQRLNSIIMSSDDAIIPDSVIHYVIETSEQYLFEDPHSELWVKESNLRSDISDPILATGYDIKEQVGTGTVMFSSSSTVEPRIVPHVSYLYKKYQYKKVIQIPKDATLILPHVDIMHAYRPMGYNPGRTDRKLGYASVKVPTDNNYYDTHHLVTEIWEITHNISGQQVAPANNPIYTFVGFRFPANIIFKYQYESINW